MAEVQSIMQRRNKASESVDKTLRSIHADFLESVPGSLILERFYYFILEVYTQFNERGWQALKSSSLKEVSARNWMIHSEIREARHRMMTSIERGSVYVDIKSS